MRYKEIVTPVSHPYVAIITIDPADFEQFEALIQDRDEVRLLGRVTGPDVWTLRIGCASEEVASRMEDGWA